MKHATVSEDGYFSAFYSEEIHGNNIPENSISVTDDQWLDIINHRQERKWDAVNEKIIEVNFPQLTLDELKLNALNLIDQGHAAILRQLTGNATIEERDTWQSKALAAYAISEGNANSYQNDMISTEAVMSGIEVSELVTKILSRNAAFMKMIGIAAGHRTATRAAINKASSVQELKTVLSLSEEKANELIQGYMDALNGG